MKKHVTETHTEENNKVSEEMRRKGKFIKIKSEKTKENGKQVKMQKN